MYKPSARYLAEIAKSDYTAIAKLEVWSPLQVWQETLRIVPGANVNVDENRQVRRTLASALESPDASLVPAKPGDLLHPLTGNEFRPFRGVRFQDGTEEYVPLGIFPVSVDVQDTGDHLTIDMNANDRSAAISARGWVKPYAIVGGTNLGTAVHDLLEDRWPGGTYNFSPTDYAVPDTVFGTDLSQPTDPWADANSLVIAGAMELFFDVTGTRVMRPISNPATDPVTAQFVEGKGSKLISVGRTIDVTKAYNGVVVIGNGTGGPAVRGEVWDTDPTSPTYFLGPWGQRPYPITTPLVPYPGQSNVDAIAQATAIAQAQFQIVCHSMDSPTWSGIPDGTVQEGDCAQLTRLRAALNSQYAVSALTIPLDVDKTTSYTGRPRRSA